MADVLVEPVIMKRSELNENLSDDGAKENYEENKPYEVKTKDTFMMKIIKTKKYF